MNISREIVLYSNATQSVVCELVPSVKDISTEIESKHLKTLQQFGKVSVCPLNSILKIRFVFLSI